MNANEIPVDRPADPTLEKIDELLVEQGHTSFSIDITPRQEQHRRGYLGASSIGKNCNRELWYWFRWALPGGGFSVETIKAFEDGHIGESVMAERLRMVPGLQLWTTDEDSGQFGFSLHGHFAGHIDGVVKGLLQSPKKPHIWEHKQVGEKKFNKLLELAKKDESKALKKWDKIYYAQAQVYMHAFNIKAHYLTCSTPGGRDTISCITKYNKKDAESLIAKALDIIESPAPPLRISSNPDYFECRWCNFLHVCHGNQLPSVNCRTCLHSNPATNTTKDGRWICGVHGKRISFETQQKGCNHHIYITDFFEKLASLIEFNEEENVAYYSVSTNNGDESLANGSNDPARESRHRVYDSHELRAGSLLADNGLTDLTNNEIDQLREIFGARVLTAEQEKIEMEKEGK